MIGIFILSACAGILLLGSVFLIEIPEERSSQILENFEAEGWYPRETIHTAAKHEHFHSYYPDVMDFGTDRLILDFCLENPETDIFQHASWVGGYTRYWHGYAIVWRPLLAILDLSELRLLNFGVQLILVGILALKLLEVTGKKRAATAVFLMYYLSTPEALGNCLQYSLVFDIAVVSSILLLQFASRLLENERYCFLFLATGMLTAYFDLLTFPLITWAFPATLLVVIAKEGHVVKVIKSGLFWILGYAGFWIEKFVVAVLFGRSDGIEDGINEVLFMSGASEGLYERLKGLVMNYKPVILLPYGLVICGIAVCIIVGVIKYGLTIQKKAAAYFLVAVSPLAWYMVVFEHSYTHHFFTWRTCLAGVAAFLAFSLSVIGHKENNKKISVKNVVIAGLTMLVSAALFLTMTWEDLSVSNFEGEQLPLQIEPGQEDALEMVFIPQHRHLKQISLLYETPGEGGLGICVFNDSETYRGEFEGNKDGEVERDHTLDANWDLKPGQPYTMKVSTVNVKEPVTVWVNFTTASEEFSQSSFETLMTLTYRVHPSGWIYRIFWCLLWFLFLMMLEYTLFSLRAVVKWPAFRKNRGSI